MAIPNSPDPDDLGSHLASALISLNLSLPMLYSGDTLAPTPCERVGMLNEKIMHKTCPTKRAHWVSRCPWGGTGYLKQIPPPTLTPKDFKVT